MDEAGCLESIIKGRKPLNYPRKWHTLNRRILHSSPSLHVTLASSACCPCSTRIPWPWPEARAQSSPMAAGGAVGWREGWDEVEVEDDGRSMGCEVKGRMGWSGGWWEIYWLRTPMCRALCWWNLFSQSQHFWEVSAVSWRRELGFWENSQCFSWGHEERHERQMISNMVQLVVEYKKQNTSADNNAHTFLSLQLHPPYP